MQEGSKVMSEENPTIIELLKEVKQVMEYEDRVSLENNIKKVIDKLTPEYQRGDIVRHLESDETFQVFFKHFDIDAEDIYYFDAEMSYGYEASELELVKRKESE